MYYSALLVLQRTTCTTARNSARYVLQNGTVSFTQCNADFILQILQILQILFGVQLSAVQCSALRCSAVQF